MRHLIQLGLMDPLPAGVWFTVGCDLRLGVARLPSPATLEALTLEEQDRLVQMVRERTWTRAAGLVQEAEQPRTVSV